MIQKVTLDVCGKYVGILKETSYFHNTVSH